MKDNKFMQIGVNCTNNYSRTPLRRPPNEEVVLEWRLGSEQFFGGEWSYYRRKALARLIEGVVLEGSDCIKLININLSLTNDNIVNL